MVARVLCEDGELKTEVLKRLQTQDPSKRNLLGFFVCCFKTTV
jgi:hypothetical protein